MKIHEYQGKELFAKYGVAIPKGYPARSVDEAEAMAKKLIAETGSEVVVVKAQIHAGGRGKGGGVKVALGKGPGGGAKEARELAEKILGMQLVTHQTGPEGQKVRRLYIEQGLQMERELYLGAVLDRDKRRIAFMASTEGGMEIEKVAEETPEKILTVHVDPTAGFQAYEARQLAFALGLLQGPHGKETVARFVKLLASLYELFVKEDCSLCEINPLVILKNGDVVALDAKIDFDDNAEFRHKIWDEQRDTGEEDPVELEAKHAGLNYVSLDGNVGCLVNGAGLAMATMDIIKHVGEGHNVSPANFLDVGGGATQEQVTKAFKMILSSFEGEGDLRQHLRRHHEVRRHRLGRRRRGQGARAHGARRSFVWKGRTWSSEEKSWTRAVSRSPRPPPCWTARTRSSPPSVNTEISGAAK